MWCFGCMKTDTDQLINSVFPSSHSIQPRLSLNQWKWIYFFNLTPLIFPITPPTYLWVSNFQQLELDLLPTIIAEPFIIMFLLFIVFLLFIHELYSIAGDQLRKLLTVSWHLPFMFAISSSIDSLAGISSTILPAFVIIFYFANWAIHSDWWAIIV